MVDGGIIMEENHHTIDEKVDQGQELKKNKVTVTNMTQYENKVKQKH